MTKVSTLTLKNVSALRQFFQPLNKYVGPGELVDVLALCEGDSALAQTVIASYKDNPHWQVFELLEGPIPAPEKEIHSGYNPEVPPVVLTVPSEGKKTGSGGKKNKHRPVAPPAEEQPFNEGGNGDPL